MADVKVFDASYWECFATHEAFRRLGFTSDELFVGFGNVSGIDDVLHVQLQSQDKTFTVPVAKMPGVKYEDAMATWQAFAHSLPGMNESELQRRWESSSIRKNSVMFLMALIDKGFVIPGNP